MLHDEFSFGHKGFRASGEEATIEIRCKRNKYSC